MHTQKVDPRTLAFSPWNVNVVSPENMKKLRASIERFGVFRPVVARELDDGTLQIIAGEHTVRTVLDLGWPEMDVYNLGRISEARAKEISVVDNQHYGVEDAFGLGNLLKDFEVDAGSILPFTETELEQLYQSTKIDFDALEIPEDSAFSDERAEEENRADRPTATHQVMRFKVPLADAEKVERAIDRVMKREGFTGSDSLTNAGDALVWLVTNYAEQ